LALGASAQPAHPHPLVFLMPEDATIQTADQPRTVKSLSADLRALGLREGMTLLVHSSLSSLGWVIGGAQAVIEALTQTLGESGALVMSAYTTDNTEPRDWRDPPIPGAWWPRCEKACPPLIPIGRPPGKWGKLPRRFGHGLA